MWVSVLGSRHLQSFTDGGVEIFDLAAQGRIDAFFLSGGQIDGSGNINLVGIGDYPAQKVRWSGSFGSAYLYYLVPRVILFRLEHTRRTMVDQVDFISAPGTSPDNVYRQGFLFTEAGKDFIESGPDLTQGFVQVSIKIRPFTLGMA